MLKSENNVRNVQNVSKSSSVTPALYEQQPGESNKAFAAFQMYLSLGGKRTSHEVGRKLSKSWQLCERWSFKHHWVERASAYDASLAAAEHEAALATARMNGIDFAKRREQIMAEEWEMHGKCIAAAKKALDAFLAREKVWANLSDISRVLEVASKLGRLAAGMATDKTEVTGANGGPVEVAIQAQLDKVFGPVVDVEAQPVPKALPKATL